MIVRIEKNKAIGLKCIDDQMWKMKKRDRFIFRFCLGNFIDNGTIN
jgi:hypothetical protein